MEGEGAGEGGEFDRSPHLEPARYATETPGIGGRLRVRVEDFLVDEIPLYEPSGEGEHAYLLVEKRNVSTLVMVETLARHFGVGVRDVGYAGLKDRRAITRQVVSIWLPGKKIDEFPSVRDERLSILWADRHANKLRRGHLRGNRFSIRVRETGVSGVLAARATLERLARAGVPNRCGEQRFGSARTNHLIGRALVLGRSDEAVEALLGPTPDAPGFQREAREAFARGDLQLAFEHFGPHARTERHVLAAMKRSKPDRAARAGVSAMTRAERSFYVTAFQSAVFNAVLDLRLRSHTEGGGFALAPGDVAMKHDNGALFGVDEATAASPETRARLDALEISPTGPMWGVSMKRAEGSVGEGERDALARTGVRPEDLEAFEARTPGLIEGTRRPLRVPLAGPDVEAGVDEHGAFVRCSFELPRGAFATEVMREVMKPDTRPGDDAGEEEVE